MFLLSYILFLLKGCVLFTGSYSVNVFPSTLNKKDEEKYLNQMAMGDKDARSKLIEHNLRLVAHIVKKYENSSYDPDDLISIGTIGLVKGIDSYKMNKKVKLTTYAARCIENEILMHLRSNKKHLNNVSLNDSLGYDKDGNEINLIDVIKMENKDITEEINTKDNVELLYKYINKLTKREKEIIIRRYGLFNNKEMTQKEIAKEMMISRSYVSRIEKRAISKILKEFIKSNKTLWLLCFDYENGYKTEEIRNGGYMNINRDYYLNKLIEKQNNGLVKYYILLDEIKNARVKTTFKCRWKIIITKDGVSSYRNNDGILFLNI